MRILFFVSNPPSRIRVRPYHLIHELVRRGHEVVVATLWQSEEEWRDVQALRDQGISVITDFLPRWRPLLNLTKTVFSTTPLQARYGWFPSFAQQLRAELPVDVIHVEHLRGSPYALFFREAYPDVPVVWDSVDSISHLFAQAAKQSQTLKGRLMSRVDLWRTRRYEGWLVHQFAQVLVTSCKDKSVLQALAEKRVSHVASPAEKLHVLPNGVDVDYFFPTHETRHPATLVMTGRMSYHANESAALYLVQKVMPLIWAERPDVRLQLVGRDPSRALLGLSEGRITVTGSVPDLRPYLRQATLSVAPLTYGAGIQNKVLEAMACGTPVVTSRLAASGLAEAVTHGEELMIAEAAPTFAENILMLLDKSAKRQQMGEAGRRYVERYYQWSKIGEQLEALYRASSK